MILSIEGVHTFYGESHVLQGVDLEIGTGEIVALLGRNGAGKTTTVHTIVGFVRPREGHIYFGDREITGETPNRIARLGISLVPQGRRLFPLLTVEENLAFGSRAPVDGREAGAWTLDRIYELFPNLRHRKNHRADELSGGEQQMVAIGRALMTNPTLLLLDEPSEGLAPRLVDRVEGVLETLRREGSFSILLIEQNLGLATRAADRGYLMEKGRIRLECGTDEMERAEDLLALS